MISWSLLSTFFASGLHTFWKSYKWMNNMTTKNVDLFHFMIFHSVTIIVTNQTNITKQLRLKVTPQLSHWCIICIPYIFQCRVVDGMQRKPIRGCDDTFQSIVWLYIASVPIMLQFTSSPIKDWCYFFKFSFNFAAMLPKINRLNNTYVLPIWIQFGLIWMKNEGELEKITPPYFCQEYKIDQVT